MDKEQKITNNIKVPNKDMEVLKKYFSHCFNKSGNFDIEKFKQELSENEIDFYKESYGMDWLGKSYARLLANDSATTLLKEDEEFNKNDENKNSENLLIKGDNLEVLKHLSNAYYEKIKMIYIDPPYNTGSDGFVYEDDRKFTIDEFRNLVGVDADKAKRILSFVDSKSNSHSAWLTFMYPRLYIAKQLLKDDGVIFISIDDNEVAQLRLLMDEVFGEENFYSQVIVRANSRGQTYNQIAKTHEYIFVYTKSNIGDLSELEKNGNNSDLNLVDNIGNYNIRELRNRNPKYGRHNRPNLFYPIFINPNKVDKDGFYPVSLKKTDEYNIEIEPLNSKYEESCWRWGTTKFNDNLNSNTLNSNVVGKKKNRGNTYGIYEKYRKTTYKPKSVWDDNTFLTETGTVELKAMGLEGKFDFPKPVGLIKRCVELSVKPDDQILDFFAGSGTTGDAVIQLNAEDGGNRKYILVQLPEKIDPKKNKLAYDFVKEELNVEKPTIFEIIKERLIRSTKKTKEKIIKTKITEKQKEIKELENQLDLDNKEEKIKQLKAEIKALRNQDLGFKIFETMPIWEDYNFEADELDEQLTLFDESKLTENDLKALLVTWKTYDGIALTNNLQEIDLGEYTGYYASYKLYLTNKGFKTENLKALLEKIDFDKKFNPTSIIAFGYHFESKNLREIAENIKSYANKKNIDIDFITRY